MDFALWLLVGYLTGSVSFAVVCTRLLRLPDPRKQGSQNPGATNVLRTAGKKAAILTLIGDLLKSAVVLFAAKWSGEGLHHLGWIGLATVLGHAYPIYLKFKGGKGVATTLGVLLTATPIIGGVTAVVWLLIIKTSRYSSLAALVSIGLSPALALFIEPDIAPAYMLLTLLVFDRHRENIKRLQSGSESKI